MRDDCQSPPEDTPVEACEEVFFLSSIFLPPFSLVRDMSFSFSLSLSRTWLKHLVPRARRESEAPRRKTESRRRNHNQVRLGADKPCARNHRCTSTTTRTRSCSPPRRCSPRCRRTTPPPHRHLWTRYHRHAPLASADCGYPETLPNRPKKSTLSRITFTSNPISRISIWIEPWNCFHVDSNYSCCVCLGCVSSSSLCAILKGRGLVNVCTRGSVSSVRGGVGVSGIYIFEKESSVRKEGEKRKKNTRYDDDDGDTHRDDDNGGHTCTSGTIGGHEDDDARSRRTRRFSTRFRRRRRRTSANE